MDHLVVAFGGMSDVSFVQIPLAAFRCGAQERRLPERNPEGMTAITDRVRPHIVLVGVAAVGKTTLGAAVAPKVGLPFYDNEQVMERRHGVTLEDLSRKPENDEIIDRLLWETYQELAAETKRTLIVASPRLLGRRDFWELTRERAVTIHLRSTPLKVLRRDTALQTGVPLSQVSLSEADKAAYYYYYWWRLRHCQKANHELRLQGDFEVDGARLAEFVGSVIATVSRR
jgi:shikimate kinase